ncbi:MAG TPA: erythromycin esterase family protein [Thermoanaerobaculia bacterium]|jgi:erythromycin esterase|nr:erythromycin esterase family protein [Thermoanaerobaculia bacterium]
MKRAASLLIALLLALPLAARVRAVRSAPPAESPESWLRSRAIAVEDFDPGDATVVALGDVTHGTHETYAAKQLLIPRLVARGFRTIIIEAPYTEYKALDAYVLRGTGDPTAAIDLPFYWFWDTNEILEIVEWARAQNAAGLTPPIRIEGVDPTEPRSTAAEVVTWLRRVDAPAAVRAEDAYLCIRAGYRGADWCRDGIAAIRASMELRRDAYALASSADDVEEMLHAARVVEQGERVLAEGFDTRDRHMAENILRRAARGEKVIAIGHNEHWGRTPYILDDPNLQIPSAGSYLAAALGDRYFALGSLVLEGTFLAVQYSPGLRSAEVATQVTSAPSEDDFALLFSRSRLETAIVPLRGSLPPWLAGTHRLRFAGSAVPSRERTMLDVPADLAAKFDAVLYVRTSTPTQLRHWPRF